MLRESCKIYDRCAHTPNLTAQKLYYYPQYTGHFVCNADFYISRRGYSGLLVLYTIRGSAKLNYRGKEYLLTPRHFALIDCRDTHTYYPEGESEWDFKFIHFAGQNCFELYNHIYNTNKSPLFESNEEFAKTIDKCIDICKNLPKSYEITLSKLLSNYLHNCLLQIQSDNSENFSTVCDYIRKHYNTISSTEALAQHFSFSRSYFCVQFKKHIGVSVHEYILCCKLEAAKILLFENVLSIDEIAHKCGFADTGTFIRAFKRKENRTPAQYRKNLLYKN